MLRFDLLVTRMIDMDLYVLPTIAHYILDIPQGHKRSGVFLSRTATLNNSNKNVSYHALLARNAGYILDRATPFARSPQVENLFHLQLGQVGCLGVLFCYELQVWFVCDALKCKA